MTDNKRSLRDNAEDFVTYKKSLGYVYDTQQHYLMRYVNYTEKISNDICIPDKNSVCSFVDIYSDAPGSLYNCTAVLREFSRYLRNKGFSNVFMIPAKRTPQMHPKPPYFFTNEEIDAVFEECDRIKPHGSFRGRETVLPAMFRVIYCCGLRCKETTYLLCENVNISEKYIDILQSKGFKSRRIFVSDELSEYLKDYDTSIRTLFPERKYFFPHKNNTCYSSSVLNRNFQMFWNKVYPSFIGDITPTVYDFRHHFAYYNLNRWAKEGLDVNVMLPYLMRYMGHKSIKSTLYYFHFVPEFFPTYQEMSSFSDDIMPEVSYEE